MWTGVLVKNCERSKFLPYLQAGKLACHSFMNTGRKYEIPGLELNNLSLKAIEVARVSAFLHWI